MREVDVLIVGGGPAGSSTAMHLCKLDPSWAKRIVLIDKAKHPRPKLCGGAITYQGLNALRKLGVESDVPSLTVRELRASMGDIGFSLHGNPIAEMIRRPAFDHWLLKTAEQWGVEVRQPEGAVEIRRGEDAIEVETNGELYRAKVLVGADGSKSTVRQKLDWPGKGRLARLLELDTSEDEKSRYLREDGVVSFDFTPIRSGVQGYYWDFPSLIDGCPVTNRGIYDGRIATKARRGDLRGVLGSCMEERGRSIDEGNLEGHPIRWYDWKYPIAESRIILVGDAAGVDPLWGEGIAFAISYGGLAANQIDNAFKTLDFRFTRYRNKVHWHWLTGQLRTRLLISRLIYGRPKFAPYVMRMLGAILKRTRWGKLDHQTLVPLAELPAWLTDRPRQ